MNARVRTHLLVAGLTVVCSPAAFAQIVINEVVYDNAGSDTHCWLELKGPGGMSLDGLEVVGVNGNGGVEYQAISLAGQTIPADGYFVISQDGTTPNSDMTDSNVNYQNGPDNIVLRDATSLEVLDALGYGNFGATDIFVGEGSPAPGQTNDISLARCPDGEDTNDNSVDFVLDADPTPGTANDAQCGGPGDPTAVSLCEVAANDADGVPVLLNEYVICTGVVISPSGIFSTSTNDIKITDGECCITVFGGDLMPIALGDEVEVIGTVSQFNGLTEISNPLLEINIISTGNPIP
ncbi:MAG: lamin tail domain-containing protein, partial [Candidatus Eisenbacteria bacterium]|nr:lamin tail domain-containing protein [Candidatus Eisenbacteria bacterium]